MPAKAKKTVDKDGEVNFDWVAKEGSYKVTFKVSKDAQKELSELVEAPKDSDTTEAAKLPKIGETPGT